MTVRLKLDAFENDKTQQSLLKLTVAAVGFHKKNRETGKYFYEFYTHGGDYAGSSPVHYVASFICYMRNHVGLSICDYPMHTDTHRPVTFGWHPDLVEQETVERWMEELHQTPIQLK